MTTFFKQSFFLAVMFIVILGVTDYLHGLITHKFNQMTELGKILDPVTDKLKQLVLILSLLWHFHQFGGY
ncbi:CDP-alcohol phosphatidyltransferase family protein [Enterococcus ratti]|nr:CDP-alcohol phosphatidyltransferase family protein [Enterococcus ratti]